MAPRLKNLFLNMSTEDISEWDKRCIVCGKSVEKGGELCHLDIEGHMIAICCPLCLETFEKNPETYLRRQSFRKLVEKAKPPGVSDIYDA